MNEITTLYMSVVTALDRPKGSLGERASPYHWLAYRIARSQKFLCRLKKLANYGYFNLLC